MEIKVVGVSTDGRFYLNDKGDMYDTKNKKLTKIQTPKHFDCVKIEGISRPKIVTK